MIKSYSIRKVQMQLINKASKAISQLGKEWHKASVIAAPTGPTGDLKHGLMLIERPGTLKVRMISGVRYARRIAYIFATHVPKAVVGKVGWQDSVSGGNRRQRYYKGLRQARQAGAPQYVWIYWRQAFDRIGGVNRYKAILGGIG